jgi:hypothetical protein
VSSLQISKMLVWLMSDCFFALSRRKYYYLNVHTGESQWTKPLLLGDQVSVPSLVCCVWLCDSPFWVTHEDCHFPFLLSGNGIRLLQRGGSGVCECRKGQTEVQPRPVLGLPISLAGGRAGGEGGGGFGKAPQPHTSAAASRVFVCLSIAACGLQQAAGSRQQLAAGSRGKKQFKTFKIGFRL